MMNYPEYEQAKEYRNRLRKLLGSGMTTLSAKQLKAFSPSITSKITQLENEMSQFEKSSCGTTCAYFGLRTFNISARVAANESKFKFNMLWNSPPQQPSTMPVHVTASQRSLLPEDENLGLPMPSLA
jgi:hypothetical protein